MHNCQKMHFNFIDVLYCVMATNMFWPLMWPPSGWNLLVFMFLINKQNMEHMKPVLDIFLSDIFGYVPIAKGERNHLWASRTHGTKFCLPSIVGWWSRWMRERTEMTDASRSCGISFICSKTARDQVSHPQKQQVIFWCMLIFLA
jgi:hypothetical protein